MHRDRAYGICTTLALSASCHTDAASLVSQIVLSNWTPIVVICFISCHFNERVWSTDSGAFRPLPHFNVHTLALQ